MLHEQTIMGRRATLRAKMTGFFMFSSELSGWRERAAFRCSFPTKARLFALSKDLAPTAEDVPRQTAGDLSNCPEGIECLKTH
jgi:hypothetical protein